MYSCTLVRWGKIYLLLDSYCRWGILARRQISYEFCPRFYGRCNTYFPEYHYRLLFLVGELTTLYQIIEYII